MSLRSHFKFIMFVAKLSSLCKEKSEHHRAREKYYREQFVEAEKDLKTNGILMLNQGQMVLGSGAVTNSYSNSYGQPLAPTFDPERVKKIDECKKKINEHCLKAEEYEKYGKTFSVAYAANNSAEIELDADDVAFFDIPVK